MKKISPLGIVGFEFDELEETAKDKVISDHIQFWIDFRHYNAENKGNFERAIDEAERNRTPWFQGSYIWDYCKDEVLDDIRSSNYLFDKNGSIIPILSYKDSNGQVIRRSIKITPAIEVDVIIEKAI